MKVEIELSYNDLQALNESFTEMSKFEVSYSVGKKILDLQEVVEKESKKLGGMLQKVQEKFIPKDEEGKPILQEGSFVPTDINEYQTTVNVFASEFHVIEFPTHLKFDDIDFGDQKIKLSTMSNINKLLTLIHEKNNQE